MLGADASTSDGERARREEVGDRRIADDRRGRPRRSARGSRSDAAALSRRRRSAIGRDFSATARSNSRAPSLAHDGGVHARGDLQVGGVLPGREVVGERLEAEAPHALLERARRRSPSGRNRRRSGGRRCSDSSPDGREQPHVHADAIVTLAERGRAGTARSRRRTPWAGTAVRHGGEGQREGMRGVAVVRSG